MTGMLRSRSRNGDRQAGFTFVEMLVTVIMIGLLSAIMIPIFLGSREKASGATAEALLRTGAATVEAVAVDTDGYAAITPAQLAANEPNVAWQSAPGAQAPDNQVTRQRPRPERLRPLHHDRVRHDLRPAEGRDVGAHRHPHLRPGLRLVERERDGGRPAAHTSCCHPVLASATGTPAASRTSSPGAPASRRPTGMRGVSSRARSASRRSGGIATSSS